ncbi:MAG: pantoate--beta-alanine ligase [Streptosporangiales bacterium]|nr:pantoate--beta-alanine ligase [Streptosporangiales bacterium]
MPVRHMRSVAEARPVLRELWRSGGSIGSVHTLGALHEAHAELIRRSASENDQTVVTIYPNKIQLFPGSIYRYDLEQDVAVAERAGATLVISSDDEEMYPPGYCTYIDQGELHRRLNSSVFDFASRGQVTGAVRWISLCRPHASYFGMKDIEQSLLVERAVKDLLIDCQVRHVPCVRLRGTGVPVSSRLRDLPPDRLEEVGGVYRALEAGRTLAAAGEQDADRVLAAMREVLDASLRTFRLTYLTVVDLDQFAPMRRVRVPFILHCAITDGTLSHFDGLYISSRQELVESPEVVWIDGPREPQTSTR